MKRFRFIFPLFFCAVIQIQAQSPEINVDIAAINQVIVQGDTAYVTLLISNTGSADLDWTASTAGNSVDFVKNNHADWTLPANQDIITPGVKITRKDTQGLFNFALDTNYDATTPTGTEWCFGYTSELTPADYTYWIDAVSHNPQSMVNNIISLHLVEDDLFFDVLFHSYSGGPVTGGGFSYTRTSVPTWFYAFPAVGTVASGSSQEITAVMDGRSLKKGVHTCKLLINSNDPITPVVVLQVELTITGIPVITVEPDSLNFNTTNVGKTKTLTVKLTNIGTEQLELSEVQNSLDEYFVSLSDTIFSVGESNIMEILFIPKAQQTYYDTIQFHTNDPQNALVKIPLSGIGQLVPGVSISPMSIHHVSDSNHTDTLKISIVNVGDTNLIWHSLIQQNAQNTVSFTKSAFADWTQAENQDRINDTVWLTRATTKGIFNIASENSYVSAISPKSTEWAFDYSLLNSPGDYSNWETAVAANPTASLNKPMSLHLINSNTYYDIIFHSWSASSSGGGFSYTRAPAQSWLKLSAYSDTLSAADSSKLDLIINPATLDEGLYTASIIFWTNDPENPELVIPVSFRYGGTFVKNHLPDLQLNEGFDSVKINLTDVFTDVQGDSLVYSVLSTDYQVIECKMSGIFLLLDESGLGTAEIHLTATDEFGHSATDSFSVLVNDVPKIIHEVTDKIINEGFLADTVIISHVFTDINTLSLSAESLNQTVVTVELSDTILVIHEAGIGETTIIIAADDGLASPVNDSFKYRVNAYPDVLLPLEDISIEKGFGTYSIQLSDVFKDTETTALFFSASSSNTAIVTVEINESTLILTEITTGNSTITVTASDADKASISDEFVFSVKNVNGLTENIEMRYYDIFPNPANELIKLFVDGSVVSVAIINQLGETIFVCSCERDNCRELDLTQFSKGIYYLKFSDSDNRIALKKLVIR